MHNDTSYLTEAEGITRVPKERWGVAQNAEHFLWMEEGLWWNSAGNEGHKSHFDHYSMLRGKRFESAIELGCGPFTNLRMIGDLCEVLECSLLDPLLESYLAHPSCSYSRHSLFVSPFDHMSRPLVLVRKIRKHFPFLSRLLLDVCRALRGGNKIPIKQLYSCPIEEMPSDRTFDLVVMINVIEHCYDLEVIFRKILEMTKPGAIVVFQDHLYTHHEVVDRAAQFFDAYHPLMVDRSLIDRFLASHFTQMYRKEKLPEVGGEGDAQHGSVYFVGSRLGTPK